MQRVLGVAVPNIEVVELLGTLFVSALKGVAPILVFFLVISALANARAAGSMKTVVLLYVVSTFVAARFAQYGMRRLRVRSPCTLLSS